MYVQYVHSMNKKIQCPYCGATAMSWAQKWMLGPMTATKCRYCGRKIGAPRWVVVASLPLAAGVFSAWLADAPLLQVLLIVAGLLMSTVVHLFMVPLEKRESGANEGIGAHSGLGSVVARIGFSIAIGATVIGLIWALIFIALVATKGLASPVVVLFLAGLVYAGIWLGVAALLVDATSHLYGLKRPALVPSGNRYTWRLTHPLPLSRLGVVGYSLMSYALTIYGFGLAYIWLSQVDEKAFNVGRLDAVAGVYFSLVTAASVGYGDIAPATVLARCVVMVEICISILYTVFLFSIVAGFARDEKSRGTPPAHGS